MKLLLYVLLLLHSSTNVTSATPTLNEIARGQNTSISSPNGLSAVRNLKQATTSGTSQLAENAEERDGFGASLKKVALSLTERSSSLRGKIPVFKKTPEKLFSKLKFDEEGKVFESWRFKAWVAAIVKRDGEKVGDTIEASLRKVPEELKISYDTKLATMLIKTWDPTRVGVKITGPYGSFLSYLKARYPKPEQFFKALQLDTDLFLRPNRNIWRDYAKHSGFADEYITAMMSRGYADINP